MPTQDQYMRLVLMLTAGLAFIIIIVILFIS